MPDTAADILPRALAQLSDRNAGYERYAAYYDGIQRLAFATTKFNEAFGSLFRAFADNLCATVVDVLSDRLTINRFDLEDATDASTIADDAWAIWRANRMDRRAGEVHTEAFTAGDAYVIVWQQDDAPYPSLYPNRARSMTVGYNDETPGLVDWAAKVWQRADRVYRMTLYYPDRIEKYVTARPADGNVPDDLRSWQPYQVEREAWPLPNPWGQVPVFHVANNAAVGEYGRSELRDVLSLQDALNKASADMMVAMEFHALPQRWATGVEAVIDPDTGRPARTYEPGRFWQFAAPDTALGQFPSADLTQFHATLENFRKEIATVSRTPLHYIIPPTGTFPSGESLKTAEASFLAKVRDRQVSIGNVWEDVLTLALRMQGIEAGGRLTVGWESAEPRSDVTRSQIVQTLTSAGASLHGAATVAGYDEQETEALTQTDMVDDVAQ